MLLLGINKYNIPNAVKNIKYSAKYLVGTSRKAST